MRMIFLGCMFFVSALIFQQEEDRTSKLLKDISKHINQAGQQYKAEKYKASANQIGAAQNKMARCFRENDAAYKDDLIKEYKRIAKAHELLIAKGMQMKELTPFPDDFGTATAQKRQEEMESSSRDDSTDDQNKNDADEIDDEAALISFKSTVAPLLAKHCGNCHISHAKGEFSLASFDKMMEGSPGGDSIVAGEPEESLLFELIDSGDMPPKKAGKMSRKEKAVIRQWIEEGAKFDGDDASASFGKAPGRGRRGR